MLIVHFSVSTPAEKSIMCMHVYAEKSFNTSEMELPLCCLACANFFLNCPISITSTFYRHASIYGYLLHTKIC